MHIAFVARIATSVSGFKIAAFGLRRKTMSRAIACFLALCFVWFVFMTERPDIGYGVAGGVMAIFLGESEFRFLLALVLPLAFAMLGGAWVAALLKPGTTRRFAVAWFGATVLLIVAASGISVGAILSSCDARSTCAPA